MPQHSPAPPDECASCRRIFARLQQHAASGGGRLRAADLGRDVGLRERALRIHLAHLELHRRIMSDRRTPVRGAVVEQVAELDEGAWPTPIGWAESQTCRDATCRKVLRLLARKASAAWDGQLGIQEIADMLGCCWRTAQTHRQHLINDGLLRVTPDGDQWPSGHPLRRPDRYVLCAGQTAPPARNADEEAALDILARVPWWVGGDDQGAAPDEVTKAVRRIIRHLRAGWPAHELVRRLAIEPRNPVYSRIALARQLLPRVDEEYAIPAWHEVAPPRGRPARPVCPGCERPYSSGSRPVEGQLCRTCAPPGELTDVPIVRGAGTPVF